MKKKYTRAELNKFKIKYTFKNWAFDMLMRFVLILSLMLTVCVVLVALLFALLVVIQAFENNDLLHLLWLFADAFIWLIVYLLFELTTASAMACDALPLYHSKSFRLVIASGFLMYI